MPLSVLRPSPIVLRMLQPMNRRQRQNAARHVLVAMRLEDMHVVHPDQDNTRSCSKCGHIVGIYPSGQKALKRWLHTRIMCARCVNPTEADETRPAAESREEHLAEMAASTPRPRS
jgi:hypothetical protein